MEVFLTDSMIAAGMEAKREAETLCLEEVTREIEFAQSLGIPMKQVFPDVEP